MRPLATGGGGHPNQWQPGREVLIDCTNPLASDLSGLTLGLTTSAGEQVAGWAPGARVVKAFNTIGAANFGNAQFGSQKADGYYCGDDAAAKATVRELVVAAGFDQLTWVCCEMRACWSPWRCSGSTSQ